MHRSWVGHAMPLSSVSSESFTFEKISRCHAVPSHRSIRGATPVYSCKSSKPNWPTAMHDLGDTHATSSKLASSSYRRCGGKRRLQRVPSHESAIARSLPAPLPNCPTAMHIDETQETPLSSASLVPGGIGAGRQSQVDPSQDSMSGRSPAERAPRYGAGTSSRPTATHEPVPSHETDESSLSTTREGGCGVRSDQAPPANEAPYGTWTPYGLSMKPTETHVVARSQAIARGLLSITGDAVGTAGVDARAMIPAAISAPIATNRSVRMRGSRCS